MKKIGLLTITLSLLFTGCLNNKKLDTPNVLESKVLFESDNWKAINKKKFEDEKLVN